MKLKKSLYTILQYISTIDDPFPYLGNGYLVTNDKIGSGFVEVKAPEDFFKEELIIRSLSKFLRLFTFDKKDKTTDPDSIQNWELGAKIDPITRAAKKEMYITSPGRNIKLSQGLQTYLEKRRDILKPRFDNIELYDSVKFQLTHALYKQIISDCSLLDLDTITFSSINDDVIKISLTKQGKGAEDDYSTFEVECKHTHCDTRIRIQLSTFCLIDATDHQIEFGKYLNKYDTTSYLLKIKSFCDNGYVVNRVIIGTTGDNK